MPGMGVAMATSVQSSMETTTPAIATLLRKGVGSARAKLLAHPILEVLLLLS